MAVWSLLGQYNCKCQKKKYAKPIGKFFSFVISFFFPHSFDNFIEHLLYEEQKAGRYEVPKDESAGILHLP